MQLSQHCHSEPPPGGAGGGGSHTHPVPHPKYSHHPSPSTKGPPGRVMSGTSHFLSSPSPPLPPSPLQLANPDEPSPPGGSRGSCRVTGAGAKFGGRKKVSARARRNKVRKEITIFLRLGEWRGPSLSAVCCPIPGESTTSLPHVSAAGRRRAAEEGHRLSTASSKSGQPLLYHFFSAAP